MRIDNAEDGVADHLWRCLGALTDGFQERPDTTFGTMNAGVLEHFAPDFHRIDFVDVIKNSAWPE